MRQLHVDEIAFQLREAFDGGAWKLALQIWQDAALEGQELLYAWTLFKNPIERAWLKQDNRIYIDEYLNGPTAAGGEATETSGSS
jgi:hypothetical protein